MTKLAPLSAESMTRLAESVKTNMTVFAMLCKQNPNGKDTFRYYVNDEEVSESVYDFHLDLERDMHSRSL